MNTRLYLLLAGLLGALTPVAGGPALAAEEHMMRSNPTAADFIQALTPVRTRGIKPQSGVASQAVYADVPMITFQFGSADLTPGARDVLDQLAAALQSSQLSGSRFLIEGHTDAVGSETANMRLSERRARAALDYLASKQVGASRLDAVGRGETELVEQTTGPSEVNRRVRIVNLGE